MSPQPGAAAALPASRMPTPPPPPRDSAGTHLAAQDAAAPASALAGLATAARYLQAARAPSTRRAYAGDWAHFTTWCAGERDQHGHPPEQLPAAAETVAAYLAEHAGRLSVATLTRRCSAISAVHQAAGHPTPTTSALVRTTMAGIRRVHGVAPAAKDPLLAHQVRRLLDALPDPARAPGKTLIAARDRALLVLGFYGALRRSELVALDTTDVEVNDHALVLTLRRSKTDQEGAGRRVALLHTGSVDSCPVEVYTAWLAALDADLAALAARVAQADRAARAARAAQDDADPIGAEPAPGPAPTAAAGPDPTPASTSGSASNPTSGAAAEVVDPVRERRLLPEDGHLAAPVFRPVTRHGHVLAARLSDRAVARVVQRTAAAARLGDLDLAGHSLRAGFATSAAAAGKSERAIMKQTGHTSLPMVRRYIREGSLYRDNATDGLTL